MKTNRQLYILSKKTRRDLCLHRTQLRRHRFSLSACRKPPTTSPSLLYNCDFEGHLNRYRDGWNISVSRGNFQEFFRRYILPQINITPPQSYTPPPQSNITPPQSFTSPTHVLGGNCLVKSREVLQDTSSIQGHPQVILQLEFQHRRKKKSFKEKWMDVQNPFSDDINSNTVAATINPTAVSTSNYDEDEVYSDNGTFMLIDDNGISSNELINKSNNKVKAVKEAERKKSTKRLDALAHHRNKLDTEATSYEDNPKGCSRSTQHILFARSGEYLTVKVSQACLSLNLKVNQSNESRLLSFRSRLSGKTIKVDSKICYKSFWLPSSSSNVSSSVGSTVNNTYEIHQVVGTNELQRGIINKAKGNGHLFVVGDNFKRRTLGDDFRNKEVSSFQALQCLKKVGYNRGIAKTDTHPYEGINDFVTHNYQIRPDGRGLQKYRPAFMKEEGVNSASGLTYDEFDNTKVFVSTFGPRENKEKLMYSDEVHDCGRKRKRDIIGDSFSFKENGIPAQMSFSTMNNTWQVHEALIKNHDSSSEDKALEPSSKRRKLSHDSMNSQPTKLASKIIIVVDDIEGAFSTGQHPPSTLM